MGSRGDGKWGYKGIKSLLVSIFDRGDNTILERLSLKLGDFLTDFLFEGILTLLFWNVFVLLSFLVFTRRI